MKCKKCKKECLESELRDEVCFDCKNKSNKNSMIITIIISVFVSVLISLLIVGWANSGVGLKDFKIESFNIDTEKNSYSTAYDGKGKISCTDKENDYIVLLEVNNKTDNEISYTFTIIHEGLGEITTYDSSYSGTTQKPEYEFNIIGYRSFKHNN